MNDINTDSESNRAMLWIILACIGGIGVVVVCAIWLLTTGDGDEAPPGKTPGSDLVFSPQKSRPGDLPAREEKKDKEENKDKEDKKDLGTPAFIQPLDKAVFLGTQAQGRRFCIIADASNSMKGAPLNQLKKEILQTLTGLNSTSQFYVIFFNATAIPMPYPGWLNADKENLEKVRPWVQNMGTILKTLPASSFERAFKLQPKPDVIFFMTDGFIPKKENIPGVLGRLNAQEPKTAVHTILFTKPKIAEAKVAPAADQLRIIAEKNGGTFRRVSQK